ncbi:MAG: glycosyltransferase [Kiritimatiellia bacterium]
MIAGSGPLERDLHALVRRLSLDTAVTFTGWLTQEEIRAHLLAARAVALPSRRTADGDRDGIANILLEAMALGTPVVTTEAGAAGEVHRGSRERPSGAARRSGCAGRRA